MSSRHTHDATATTSSANREPQITFNLRDQEPLAPGIFTHTTRARHSLSDEDATRPKLPEQGQHHLLRDDPNWRDHMRQRAASQRSPPNRDDLTARRLMLLQRHHSSSAAQQIPGTEGLSTNLQDHRRYGHRSSMETTFNDRRASLQSRTSSVGHADTTHTAQSSRPPYIHQPSNRVRPHGLAELPKWQPDEDVSECPICGTMFTFWYRKHHCRKCGRVVCANCSPHRITIPRQFIVHPPEMQGSKLGGSDAPEVIDLTGDDGAESGSPMRRPRKVSIGGSSTEGGEEVRLCNPCVPDPNPLPHDAQLSTYLPTFLGPQRHPSFSETQHGIQSSALDSTLPPFSPASVVRPGSNRRPQPSHGLFGGSLPLSSGRGSMFDGFAVPYNPSGPRRGQLPTQGAMDHVSRDQPLNGYPHQMRPSHPRHRHHVSVGHAPGPSGASDGLDFLFANDEHLARRMVPRPRTQLKEEDECPICHLALPPKDPDGSEIAREAHVTACIATHFAGPQVSPSNTANAASSMTTSSSTVNMRSTNDTLATMSGSMPNRALSGAPSRRRQTTGMVTYNATEKDCTSSDGETEPECVICFEEFKVGDEMGRLECLCKFHHACIRQWWMTKGPGVCPVHQQST